MTDILALIREYSLSNTDVKYENNHYIFGSERFHESTETCFIQSVRGPGHYYTLRDVIVFLEYAEKPFSDYRRVCVQLRIAGVTVKDKNNLLGYLKGELDTCPQIDLDFAARAQSASITSVPAITVEADISTAPDISVEKMQEQKQKHAALIDQSIQRPSTVPVPQSASSSVGGISGEKLEELRLLRRSQKRKVVQLESTDGLDPGYIKADRQALKQLRHDEIPAHTRATVLCKVGVDFSFALTLFNDHVLRPSNSKGSAAAGKVPVAGAGARPISGSAPSDPRRQSSSDKGGPQKSVAPPKVYAVPIIIVPVTSTICALNIVDFLEKGVYISAEEKKKAGMKREQTTSIRRVTASGTSEFRIIDNVRMLKTEDWDKVVAVFAAGPAWQFKEYHWSSPVDLFQQVLGVHVTMDNRPVPDEVQSWNCKILKINDSKRHLDAGAVNDFWGFLDNFMKLKKPWLIKPAKSSQVHGGAAGGSLPPSSLSANGSSRHSSSAGKHR